MSATPATASIVICTYTEDRWSQVQRAVDSVLAQGVPAREVIVVVDHNPALLARLSGVLGSRVTVVSNEERRGLSGGRNTGVRYATGSHVVFLDDDARAEPDWLELLLSAFDDPRVVGVGGLAVPHWEAGAAPDWLPDEFLWVVGCHYLGHRTSFGPVRSPMGANMAFTRDSVLTAGGFDAKFSTPPFDRCDDTEMAIRIVAKTGRQIVFEPGAVVRHSVSPDRNRWAYFRRRCLLEGRAKAALTQSSGYRAATSAERAYLTSTLPRGVGRRLWLGLTRRDRRQFAQAAAIVAGLGFSLVGFVHGKAIAWTARGIGRPAAIANLAATGPVLEDGPVFEDLSKDQTA